MFEVIQSQLTVSKRHLCRKRFFTTDGVDSGKMMPLPCYYTSKCQCVLKITAQRHLRSLLV